MKVNENLSVQVALNQRIGKDGKQRITICVMTEGKKKIFYLKRRVHPEHFDQVNGLVKGNSPMTIAINKQIARDIRKLRAQWGKLAEQASLLNDQTAKACIYCLTLKSGRHES